MEILTESMEESKATAKKSFKKQLIVLSAPSGAGKTTIARYLLSRFTDKLRFSVSATTREKRPGEIDGKDYYFLSREEFEHRIGAGELIEYEEIFGNYYGTLHSEVDDALARGEFLVFDVDVKGALSLRLAYPNDTFLLFVAPPSMEELERRLRYRQTESDEQIAIRTARAEMEMQWQKEFDEVIVNSDLNKSLEAAEVLIEKCFYN